MTLAVSSDVPSSHGSVKVCHLGLVRHEALEPRLEGLTPLHAAVLADACEEYRDAFDLLTTRFLAERIIPAAIEDCKFKIVAGSSNLQYADFPINEQSLDDVGLAPNGILRSVHQILEEYPLEAFASPLTALRYAARYPEVYMVAPINVLFAAMGKLWGMTFLNWQGLHKMIVRQFFLEARFATGERFLVLRRGRLR